MVQWSAPTACSLPAQTKKASPSGPPINANWRRLPAYELRIASPAVPVDHANASLVHQPSALVIAVIRRALVLIGPNSRGALRRPLSALSDCVHRRAAASPKVQDVPRPVLHSQADWSCNLISHSLVFFFFPSSNSLALLPPSFSFLLYCHFRLSTLVASAV